ncbi:hypothetical protein [Streptomyces ardesiacus]|uniref:hypothetical protein n=1 Tax=Streptomyces ardesiacus TaxID=285564 RepID=UPI0036438F49
MSVKPVIESSYCQLSAEQAAALRMLSTADALVSLQQAARTLDCGMGDAERHTARFRMS